MKAKSVAHDKHIIFETEINAVIEARLQSENITCVLTILWRSVAKPGKEQKQEPDQLNGNERDDATVDRQGCDFRWRETLHKIRRSVETIPFRCGASIQAIIVPMPNAVESLCFFGKCR